jgi:hypothetical protein
MCDPHGEGLTVASAVLDHVSVNEQILALEFKLALNWFQHTP